MHCSISLLLNADLLFCICLFIEVKLKKKEKEIDEILNVNNHSFYRLNQLTMIVTLGNTKGAWRSLSYMLGFFF